MKQLCLLLFVTISMSTTAQLSLLTGEEVSLVAPDMPGTLQWQSSFDNLNWQDIPDETGATYNFITNPLAGYHQFYRAKVTFEDCEIFSDVHEIQLISSGVPCGSIINITDIDGNVYPVVQVGADCWTATNLNTTRFNDGTVLATDLTTDEWHHAGIGEFDAGTFPPQAYAIYHDEPSSELVYGKLYNNTNPKLCPVGWHPATFGEWAGVLGTYGWTFPGEFISLPGGDALMTDNPLWIGYTSESATNETLLALLPGGQKHNSGGYGGKGTVAFFGYASSPRSALTFYFGTVYDDWTSLPYDSGLVELHQPSLWNGGGYSIRCVKN